jgi:hypothetical protein
MFLLLTTDDLEAHRTKASLFKVEQMRLPICNNVVKVGDVLVVDSPVWEDDIDPCEVVVDDEPGTSCIFRQLKGVERGSLVVVVGLRFVDGLIKPRKTKIPIVYALVHVGCVVALSTWSLKRPDVQ